MPSRSALAHIAKPEQESGRPRKRRYNNTTRNRSNLTRRLATSIVYIYAFVLQAACEASLHLVPCLSDLGRPWFRGRSAHDAREPPKPKRSASQSNHDWLWTCSPDSCVEARIEGTLGFEISNKRLGLVFNPGPRAPVLRRPVSSFSARRISKRADLFVLRRKERKMTCSAVPAQSSSLVH